MLQLQKRGNSLVWCFLLVQIDFFFSFRKQEVAWRIFRFPPARFYQQTKLSGVVLCFLSSYPAKPTCNWISIGKRVEGAYIYTCYLTSHFISFRHKFNNVLITFAVISIPTLIYIIYVWILILKNNFRYYFIVIIIKNPLL